MARNSLFLFYIFAFDVIPSRYCKFPTIVLLIAFAKPFAPMLCNGAARIMVFVNSFFQRGKKIFKAFKWFVVCTF